MLEIYHLLIREKYAENIPNIGDSCQQGANNRNGMMEGLLIEMQTERDRERDRQREKGDIHLYLHI